MNRRSMIKGAAVSGLLAGGLFPVRFLDAYAEQVLPQARIFDPRRFGARGDGSSKDTIAIQQAIDECSQAGGGTVAVSSGTYLTGTIVLKSNVNLQLEAGATLLGSTNPADYVLPESAKQVFKGPITKHLIFALQAQNISITGAGVIDGQSSHFLVRNGRPDPAPQDMWKEVAGFNWKLTNSFSPMVELAECTNVHIEGVTLQNAVGWTLRPTGCDTVVIRGIRIRNPIYTPNGDGIDPTGCQNVLISHCDISTGDDAICIKAFDPYGGDRNPSNPYWDYGVIKGSRNVVVENCILNTCCNAFKIGVETPGDYENIIFRNSIIACGDVPLNERAISGIALEMTEGGSIRDVTISNIQMKNVRTPIFIRMQHSYKHKELNAAGSLSGIKISGVRATGAVLTSSITGIPGMPVDNVTLDVIDIETIESGQAQWVTSSIGEADHGYPEARMMGRLPSFGLYCRHVSSIHLSDVHFHTTTADPRPCLAFEDVAGLSMTQVDATGNAGAQQFMTLKNVQKAVVQNCVAAENVNLYAAISGPQSNGIVLQGNDLRRAKAPAANTEDVPAGVVQLKKGPAGH
jgi:hypothetical protein